MAGRPRNRFLSLVFRSEESVAWEGANRQRHDTDRDPADEPCR